ncbi:hypothetical protein H2198_006879 [Neophaeococcomyces mojaviensis]|uniref:Uncharacterized protein n=1 Tax=Neophaeococcomyces mojaviensis TaxID=3383035 RepID=A0ACC3A1P6_9EURO|nr:hypothetical protein H2198_006879 [Knufia sp. JES_112]
MAAKHLFSNARVFTGLKVSLSTESNCLLVNGDRIEHVGNANDDIVQKAKAEGVQEHNVGGRLISPGFFDGHVHVLLFGASLSAIHLEHCKSLDDIRKAILEGAAARPSATRLVCQGWMHSMTDSKALASDIDDLDERPIFIHAKDLHSAWCNTAALKEMNVSDMPDPEGGEILRNENGKATGLMSEAAGIQIVWPHLARVTSREEKLSQIRQAIRTYNADGYTGMLELATDEEIWSLLSELHSSEGPLTLRIAAHWLIKPSKTTTENIAQVDRAIELHKQYNLDTSPNLRIAGIKVIGDGVVDACTASLREPYSSTSSNVDPIWSYDQLLPVVQHADAAGLQCALHAIGDNTVAHAVRALSALGKGRDRRHRIEHLELTSQEDARRLGEYGITASIQPVHADPAILRAWPKLIGPEKCRRAFAYKEFADGGAKLAIGTDAPTAPHFPLRNLYTATTRRSAREEDFTDTVNENFKLGLGQALQAASAGTAYSCFADKQVGTLEKGKLADFVIIDLEWDAQQLLKGQVEETWFAGRCVYKK